MKKIKLIASLLLAVMLAASLSVVFVSADETVKPVYYPNGTIILDESMFKDDIANTFKANTDNAEAYTIKWNAETGRVQFKSTKGLIYDVVKFPKGLDNYTVSADIYMTENNHGNNALFAMGINSAHAWGKSTNLQMNIYNDGNKPKVWANNVNKEGKQQAGGGVSGMIEDDYEYGTTKLSVKIQVSPQTVTMYYNDTFLSVIKKANVAYPTDVPFFMIRQNTTVEVDNLLVYSGVGEPDPSKVIGKVDPIEAPETEAPEETEAPATTEAPKETEAVTDAKEETTVKEAETTKATEKATEKAEEKSGCGSAIGFSTVALAVALSTTAVVCKHKGKKDSK